MEALVALLRSKPAASLGRLVIEAMTTHETLFFRDPLVFDSLRLHVLPSLLDRLRGVRKVRIWSAASSTGQEAYSLAMTLHALGTNANDVEIVGTDLSRPVLDRAREGIYNKFEVTRGLSTSQLLKYFTPFGLNWQLNAEIRNMVRFEPIDLRANLKSLGKFDIVLCRNVLIYFDLDTKKEIVQSLYDVLLPEGFLILGCAETVINIHSGFQRKLIGQSTYYSR